MNPDVVTTVKIPDSEFVLHIYAFRKLSPGEIKTAAGMWLRQNKRRTFPRAEPGRL